MPSVGRLGEPHEERCGQGNRDQRVRQHEEEEGVVEGGPSRADLVQRIHQVRGPRQDL